MTISTMDDSKKRPGSPGLASSTRRRRANDEINAHSSMLVAMTGTYCGRSGIHHVKRHTHHARFRYQEEHQREESSPRLGGSLRDERGPDCFRRQYRMPQQTFEKTCRYTASPASTRPPFPRTLLDERMSCIHTSAVLYRERECSTDNFALSAHP